MCSRKLILAALFWCLVAPILRASPGGVGSAVVSGVVFDASTGRVIACTVAIHTATHSIVIENPDFAGGFRSGGEFEKEVPVGRTTVTVSRGFDYVAARRVLHLRAGERVRFVFRLHRQAGLRRLGWYCGDNHIHMIHGERKFLVDFRAVALAGRAAGLDYMSIAQDWNLPHAETTPAHLTALCQKFSTPHFIFTWNMEAPKNYWRGDVSHCLGHCWELGMRGYTADGQSAIQELAQMSVHDYQIRKTPTPNFEAEALIHALGGIVVYTHPCRWWWGDWGGKGGYPQTQGKFISNLAQELPYDTVVGPTYDAIDILMQPWDYDADQAALRLWFMLLDKGYRMPATASTDSAFDSAGSAVPGMARVYTHVDGPPSIGAISRAMKAGRNFVTSGPLLLLKIGNHQVGDVVMVSRPSLFAVSLRAWPSGMPGGRLTKVQLIRDGRVVKDIPVVDGTKEFAARFTIQEAGTAWYIARCFGSNKFREAITDPIYFEGKHYMPPRLALAQVTGTVIDQATGRPLNGTLEVIRMVGLTPSVISTEAFTGGRFTVDVPGTARLRIESPGYARAMKSVFMDYEPLLRMMVNMRQAEITDWRTFEEIRHLLRGVKLNFQLKRVAPSTP